MGMRWFSRLSGSALAVGSIALAGAASASCFPMAQGTPRIIPAAYSTASVKAHYLRISYVGHSTFGVE